VVDVGNHGHVTNVLLLVHESTDLVYCKVNLFVWYNHIKVNVRFNFIGKGCGLEKRIMLYSATSHCIRQYGITGSVNSSRPRAVCVGGGGIVRFSATCRIELTILDISLS
jgi:hypothetical protein